MATVLDQATDLSGEETHRLCTLYPPPEYVKSASLSQRCGTPELPTGVFADPVNRRFPCHTKAATWLSAAFYYKNASATPKVEQVIRDAAEFFHIETEVSQLKLASEANRNEPPLTDDDFGLVYTYQGERQRRLPLRNALEVKKAAAWLSDYRDQLSYEDRRSVAARIIKKADAYGASLGEHDELVTRISGEGCCSAAVAAQFLERRAYFVQAADPSLAEELKKTAQAIRQDPHTTRDSSQLVKLATIVDQIDKQHGVTSYGGMLERPEDVLFALHPKVAARFVEDHVQLPTGALYNRQDVGSLRVSDIRDVCGNQVAEALTDDGLYLSTEKVAAVLPTLPREDAELLEGLLAGQGVTPVHRDAVGPRLTNADLAFFASQPLS